MRYISTRGEAPELGFCDTLLAGLARDGGLYLRKNGHSLLKMMSVPCAGNPMRSRPLQS
jgi:threonine synthase